MGLDEIMTIVPNQGYHLTNIYGNNPHKGGKAEIEEEQRCDLIEEKIRERQRRERRNFKGY